MNLQPIQERPMTMRPLKIYWELGSPSFEDSQKEFKLLVIVLTDEALTTEEWDTIDATAEWFSYPGADDYSSYNFWEATNGIGSIVIGE